MVNGEASCQSFIHESASKVGGKPTFEMTQYHRNLIFTIIVKKVKNRKKNSNFRSRLWYHWRHIQAVTEYNKGCPKIDCGSKTNKCNGNAKSGTTKDLTIAFARMDIFSAQVK